jgi:ATP-dependent DNA helicase RecQ
LQVIEKAVGDRRDEPVYIHPRWLMQQLQMDRDTMNRHLRELIKLESFEYVAPFRGRAIHFRRRDVAFADLKIDHATLAARKKADYEKLEQMIAYAQGRKCRQRAFLDYFGDASASNCGICDRCQGRSGWPRITETAKSKPKKTASQATTPIPSQSVSQSVSQSKAEVIGPAIAAVPIGDRKEAHDLILTILRAVERTHGYLSKTLLAQHLQGVESKAVQGLRLQRLAEFGVLKDWKKARSSGFLDLALDLNLFQLSQLRANKVTVSIAALGEECIRGTQSIPEAMIGYVHQAMQPDDTALSTRVEKNRRAEPKRTHQPEPLEESNQAIKVEQDVPQVENWTAPRPIDALPATNSNDAQLYRDPTVPTLEDWRWTVRLVQHGYRLGECALVRGKTPDAILEDLTKGLRQGAVFSIELLFDRRTQIALKEMQESGHSLTDACPPIFQSYPALWQFVQQYVSYRSGERR